ncbi:MAG TPA: CHASE3 domain-containing protein, partial [Polyangiaceae bacterium]
MLPPKTLIGFALAVLAVISIAALSFKALEQRANSARHATRTLEAVSHMQALLSLVKDAETGQRGYLLTGEDRYLEPFRQAERALPQELEQTRQSLADDPVQARRLRSVERLATDKFAELRETIELYGSGRVNQALTLVRTDRGRDVMDGIRRAAAEMLATERAELE